MANPEYRANPEHLAILKQGVDAWNEWRKQNPDIRPDLSEADLNGAYLVQADLSGVNLTGADLSGADLSGANLSGADLSNANLEFSQLVQCNLTDATLTGTRLYATSRDDWVIKDVECRYVFWDAEGGSGIVSYDIYVSDNNGPFTIWLSGTSLTEALFDAAEDGHTYAFYSVAIDGVGHREVAPEAADVQTLAVEPETAEITRITVVNALTAAISIMFSDSMTLQPMIDDQSILLAVSLTSLSSGPVPFEADWCTYDDATRTLSIMLDHALPIGGYEVRLDGSMLESSDGKVLRGGTAGVAFHISAFSAGQTIQAGDDDLRVDEYSVPSLIDWDGDGRLDLVVGEKTAAGEGKVRIYLNEGSNAAPVFSTYSYAQTTNGDLAVPATGCMGVFPRVFDWDGDGLKDLVLGLADGRIQLWMNTNTTNGPVFVTPTYLRFGPSGTTSDPAIDVGDRATFDIVDWNDDGRYDLVGGGLDGKIRLYINEAVTGSAHFRQEILLQVGSQDLVVPTGRASVAVGDVNNDGRKDLVVGNTEGQLLYYLNIGTDSTPVLNSAALILADGIPIDLAGAARSRPSLADFNGDGTLDILLGSADGLVRSYAGQSQLPAVIQPGERSGRPGGIYLYTFVVRSDSQPPVLTGWQLEEDTGAGPSDRLTNDTTPTLTFVFSEPVFGASSDVQVTDSNGDLVVPDSIAGWGTDTVTIAFTTSMSVDGQYTVTLKGTTTITDQAGNPLNNGSDEVLAFVLDTTSPSVPVVTGVGDDTGTPGDGITNDNSLVICGEAAASSTVEVFVGSNLAGVTAANSSGIWSLDYTGTSLADGTYELTATAADAAGNTSAASTAFTVVVDTAAPVAPVVTEIADDTGTAGDGITSDNTLTINGTAEANSMVTVYKDGTSIGTVAANGSGSWSLEYTSTSLADGTYALIAAATDVAGNTSGVSATFGVTIDTVAPTSHINPLPAEVQAVSFTISWSGADGGSGIASYDIYVSDNGGDYALWKDETADTSALFIGVNSHTYAFYSIARDNVGHTEEPPGVPDTQTVARANQPPVVDAGDDTQSMGAHPSPAPAPSPILT